MRSEPIGAATTARDQLAADSRYELLVRVASGGMATVYVGRISGAVGFRRLVAIKRAHAHLLEDPTFGRALVAEARLASMIHHPNVCSVQDVEELEGEILLVMDYVEGSSLSALLVQAKNSGVKMPPAVAVRILLDACAGLHAAHSLTNDEGVAIGLVHRDVSPHNVLVGIDGVARLADFGIAKAEHGTSSAGQRTTTGMLKGKVAYMAPEYIETAKTDARGDVFAVAVVAWEALAQKRLFRGMNDVDTMRLVIAAEAPPLSTVAPELGTALDDVLALGLARVPEERFQSVLAFSEALETAARREGLIASAATVATFVRSLVGPALEARRALIRKKAPSATDEEAAPDTARDVNAAAGDRKTLTLSVPPDAEHVADAEPSDSVEATDEITSLGTGAAAITFEAAHEPPPDRQRNFVPLVAAILFVIAGTTAAGLLLRRSSEPRTEGAPPSPAATTAPSPSMSAALPPASVAVAPASVDSSPPPSLAPLPATTRVRATGPARPTTRPPSTSTGRALPPPTEKPSIVTPPAVAAPPDKAPPNPYTQ